MHKNTLYKVLFVTTLLCSGCTVEAQQIVVKDGDSLVVNGQEIRLIGIDAPEYKQTCTDSVGQTYNCGLEAKDYMKRMIKNGQAKGERLTCDSQGIDRYHRKLSVCRFGKRNINKAMVQAGWAIAYMHPWYEKAQAKAKENKRGIWQGNFMRPEFYRALKRAEKQKAEKQLRP